MNELQVRLKQIVRVLEKEDLLLADVTARLFATEVLDVQWLAGVLAVPEGTDKLESFGSKFCRMQDTFVDKFTPLFLRALGELSGSAIDNLNKLERLHIINSADDWLVMRSLRNKLVHEYVEDTAQLLTHLLLAKQLATHIHAGYRQARIMLKQRTLIE